MLLVASARACVCCVRVFAFGRACVCATVCLYLLAVFVCMRSAFCCFTGFCIALQVADLQHAATSTTQTDASYFRRDNDAQVRCVCFGASHWLNVHELARAHVVHGRRLRELATHSKLHLI
jgi:hypothetical protein